MKGANSKAYMAITIVDFVENWGNENSHPLEIWLVAKNTAPSPILIATWAIKMTKTESACSFSLSLSCFSTPSTTVAFLPESTS